MKRNRLIALLTLTLFIVAMLPSTAFAYAQNKVEVTVKVKIEFKDTDGAKWALKQISELKAKDIIAGYNDGSFQPNKPVTRAEAVAMVLKATGLSEEVQQRVEDSVYGSVYLPFKDASSIPTWVKGFLSVAAEKGLLPDDQAANFQPHKPATRLWVAKLLVRALKLSDQVGADTNVELPFNDASAVPSVEAPFIAVAMENGLLQGYPDNTFKPNKPVTRAEMAVLLGLANDDLVAAEVADQEVKGTVVSVNKAVYDNVYSTTYSTITIKKVDGTESTFPVSPDVKVYVEDTAAALDDITSGLRVELVLDKDGQVIYIETKAETYRGKITVVDAAYGLTLQTKQGTLNFPLSDDAKVKINGKASAVTDLKPGMKAGIKVVDGKVAEVKAVAFKERVKEKIKEQIKDKVQDKVQEHAKNKDNANGNKR